ncbi:MULTISPECIES: hypothetical protein [Clostridium]|jgi:hypothetical protein|uniref:hypothetical protein n=1 Tax=Clostridium TaxID=1485 RepID=UPI000E82E5CF|nr:hypothetical protein [Clostridium tyrobutyricum]HBF77164.1 hypothetical protein [Clostridiaceae bacterium]
MLLKEWIENKKNELTESKAYKSVSFSHVSNVEIERNMTSEIFDLNRKQEIPMDTEVKDFVRSELTTKIQGLQITFEVVKPRCRKPEKLYLYVKVV